MLINLSNHKSSFWTEPQITTAISNYGEVTDIDFPNIDPDGDIVYLDGLVDEYFNKICSLATPAEGVIHLMGEMVFTFRLVSKLKLAGYKCVASTTKRNVSYNADGSKVALFQFCQFREY